MAIQPSQYNSFLGGEVSPLLWHRADMSQFGKWFANAENIRFTTMGSFSNRPGFKRLGPVLDSQFKPVVKLIPFVFNNEEVFEIEFITGKFRVRKNGQVIVRADGSEVAYESPIKIESLQQLKYAQSGDIIFIASGTSPVMELRRLKTDGTEWELVKFSGEFLPLGEANEDSSKTISLKKATEEEVGTKNGEFVFPDPQQNYDKYSNPIFNSMTFSFVFSDDTNYEVSYGGTLYNIALSLNRDANINKFIYFTASQLEKERLSFLATDNDTKSIKTLQVVANIPTFKDVQINSVSSWEEWNGSMTIYRKRYRIYDIGDGMVPCRIALYYDNKSASLQARSIGNQAYNPTSYEDSANLFKGLDVAESCEYIESLGYIDLTVRDHYGFLYAKVLYRKNGDIVHFHRFNDDSLDTTASLYNATFSESLNFKKGDIFSIKQSVNAGRINLRFASNGVYEMQEESGEMEKIADSFQGKYSSKTVVGNGKWRFYTSGNWVGVINIWYAKKDGDEWKLLRTTASDGVKDPGIYNENTSGAIDTNETILFKITTEIEQIGTENGMGPLNIHFFTDSFEINSYYKVVDLRSQTNAIVECIKNDVGEVEEVYQWRKSAFSDELGYPESIGFYQNRLFFAKGYELWGSKINDYWDFYEPIELKKDDPINISILSYKVNTIKNILTTKSFFVFTTGGEFGIASQGAISQDDKFLKQFSSHGSNNCQPILVGNLVLFVDSTENTIRAFQYSFESDSYEATDISLFIEEKLRGKKIVTTEYIKSTKECLFLDEDGVIWVFKYMPEQNIMSWSHWKHGRHKITNICVAPHGAYDELYVIVDAPDGKYMEKLDDSVYSDSVESFSFNEEVSEVQTKLVEGDVINVDDGINNKYKVVVGEYGKIKLRNPSKNVKIGLSYSSVGTLLTPILQIQNNTYTTYNKMKPFKVHFRYKDSFGFKVGVEEEEKMEVDFVEPHMDIEEATTLTTGKKSVLIPSRYDGTGRVSFVQDEPYQMLVENVYLEVDYGGK